MSGNISEPNLDRDSSALIVADHENHQSMQSRGDGEETCSDPKDLQQTTEIDAPLSDIGRQRRHFEQLRHNRCKFERLVAKYEMVALRPWEDRRSHHPWKDRSDDYAPFIRLYLHEVFALRAWREASGGTIAVPDIQNNKDHFRKHLSASRRYLADSRRLVESMHGKDRDFVLEGLRWNEEWCDYISEMFD